MTDQTLVALSNLQFRNSTDSEIRKAASAGEAKRFGELICKTFSKPRKQFARAFSDCPFVAVWSLHSCQQDSDERLTKILLRLQQKASRAQKLEKGDPDLRTLTDCVLLSLEKCPGTPSPIVTLVAAELLLRYGKQLSAEEFSTVFCSLAAIDVHHWSDDAESEIAEGSETPRRLIVHAEIPFVLSLLLQSLRTVKAWSANGIRAAAAAIENGTDTDGTLHASLTRYADQWAAPVVRIAGWAAAFEEKWATQKTLNRWERAIEGVAALVTPDGLITQQDATEDILGDPEVPLRILRHAARLADFSAQSDLGLLLRKPAKGKSGKKRKSSDSRSKKRHTFSEQSDWAESALLRSGNSIDADVMGLFWDNPAIRLSLAALGTRIFSGEWASRILINGKERKNAGDWVCTCWFQDKEVAFAELESGSEDGLRHVRHVMLSLDQHFAVVTDTVTCPEGDAELSCATELTLAAGVQPESNTITRELLLQTDCHAVRVVPAWLEDDRVQHADGRCVAEDQILKLSSEGRGGITMPLVLDWHPERIAGDADWSRLTITEDRHVSSPHRAGGYRVRIGSLQLLLYRSLRRAESLRAVLGLHTAHETVYGQVRKDGDVDPLVLVESEA